MKQRQWSQDTIIKRRPKLHVVTEAKAPVPSVFIDKRRITLPKLRFMGEEPHPVQLAITDEDPDPVMTEAMRDEIR